MVEFKAIVLTMLSGANVAFCWVMSQAIGLMVLQLEPVGQQRTVVFAARA